MINEDDIYLTAAEAMKILKLQKALFTATLTRALFLVSVLANSGASKNRISSMAILGSQLQTTSRYMQARGRIFISNPARPWKEG